MTHKESKFGKLTFHDSCYPGRWNGLIEAPRELLRLSGLSGNLIEMSRTKTKGLCCGAGGGRMFMEENIGKRINIERAEEIVAANVAMVAATCPYCTIMLRDGIADLNGTNVVYDIAEIIDRVTAQGDENHDTVALNFHPFFIPLTQIFEAILDLRFWICCITLLYRYLLNGQNTFGIRRHDRKLSRKAVWMKMI